MKKKDLLIKTEFQEFQSTDFKERPQFQGSIISYESSISNQYYINYELLSRCYQGLIPLSELSDKKNQQNIAYSFSLLKQQLQRSKQLIREHHMTQNDRKNKKSRQLLPISASSDRFTRLNQLADRYLNTQRIKSQQKSTKSVISSRQSKKIMSKLDNLQRMIKSIRRQNQVSNQASIIQTSKPVGQYEVHQHRVVPVQMFGPQFVPIIPSRNYLPSPYLPYKHQSPYIVSQKSNPQPYFQRSYQMYHPSTIPRCSPSMKQSGYQIINKCPKRQKIQFCTDEIDSESLNTEQQQKRELNKQLSNIKKQLQHLKQTNHRYMTNNMIHQDESEIEIQRQKQIQKRRSSNYKNNFSGKRVNTEPAVFNKQQSQKNIRYRIEEDRSNNSKYILYNQIEEGASDLFPDYQFKKPMRLQTQRSSQVYRPTRVQRSKQDDYLRGRRPYQTPVHQNQRQQLPKDSCGKCGCRFYHEGISESCSRK